MAASAGDVTQSMPPEDLERTGKHRSASPFIGSATRFPARRNHFGTELTFRYPKAKLIPLSTGQTAEIEFQASQNDFEDGR